MLSDTHATFFPIKYEKGGGSSVACTIPKCYFVSPTSVEADSLFPAMNPSERKFAHVHILRIYIRMYRSSGFEETPKQQVTSAVATVLPRPDFSVVVG